MKVIFFALLFNTLQAFAANSQIVGCPTPEIPSGCAVSFEKVLSSGTAQQCEQQLINMRNYIHQHCSKTTSIAPTAATVGCATPAIPRGCSVTFSDLLTSGTHQQCNEQAASMRTYINEHCPTQAKAVAPTAAGSSSSVTEEEEVREQNTQSKNSSGWGG